MRRGYCLSLAIILVAFVACNVSLAQDVLTDHMPGTDFTKYHTYKWTVIESGAHPDQIVDTQIKRAVDAQLATKKISKAKGDKADLFAIYQVSVDSAGNRGIVALYLYDPAKQQLVWAGYTSTTFDPSKAQQENEKALNKTMQTLLKTYPPQE